MWTPLDRVNEPLYCVLSLFNPVRYKARWKLYRDAVLRLRSAGAIVLTIEAAFGERDHALEGHAEPWRPDPDENYQPTWKSNGPAPVYPSAVMPHQRLKQDYIKVRADQQQEIWIKENLQNLALQHLPENAKYVAFIDADVGWARPDWVSETLHALQHYDVVQMFSTAIDLSPTYEPFMAHKGFAYCHVKKIQPALKQESSYYYGDPSIHTATKANLWHPGFAWAWRVASLDKVGGLIDFGVTGANDFHMARGLVGMAKSSYDGGVTQAYKNSVLAWQEKAVDQIKFNVGYIDGLLLHYWHGRKISRGYESRWQILVRNKFDPNTDLSRDWRGIYKLTDKKPQLRDDLRAYFRSRVEDDVYFPDGDDKLMGPVR